MPLRWMKVGKSSGPRSSPISTDPVQGEPIKKVPSQAKVPSQESSLKGFPVRLQVDEKGWKIVPETGSSFAPEFEKIKKLGRESRKYLLSHVKTTDPDLAAQLDALKKGKQSQE